MKSKLVLSVWLVGIISVFSFAVVFAQGPEDDLTEPQPIQADEGSDQDSSQLELVGDAVDQGNEDGQAAEGGLSVLAPVGAAFTYQGNLSDGGSPANGTYDFQFELYDDSAAGVQVGPTVIQDIAVTAGLFMADLDFGSSVFDGTALYLEIGVRPDGSADPYTILSPRQALTATPYAFSLRPGADVIGPVANDSVIEARNSAATGSGSAGIQGETDSTTGSVAGVYGRVTSATPGGFSAGVRGINEGTAGLGIGVYGSQNGSGWGVYGTTPDGIGVYGNASGTSGTNYGIYGRSSSVGGYGGYFLNVSSGDGAGLYARGSAGGAADVILGGNAGTSLSDDGRILSDPAYSSSDIFLISNDGIVLQLDSDNPSTAEDADVEVKNKNGNNIMSIDESGDMFLYHPNTGNTVSIEPSEGGSDGAQIILRKADGTAGITLDAELGVGGDARIYTEELQITGGSDLSEQFDIRHSATAGQPQPGMVVSIDAANPGELVVSEQAYDRTVAGIVSGAGDVKPGMLMGQRGTAADGKFPVALTGRVYVWADASYGAIQPGDLLTTSDTPGHAMKVADYDQAQGAVLGKAMNTLSEGRGLVLVLASLQ